MSLINRMLQDLDQRQAIGSELAVLPDQVLPVSSPREARRPLWGWLVLLLILAGAGVAYWQWQSGGWHWSGAIPSSAQVEIASKEVVTKAPDEQTANALPDELKLAGVDSLLAMDTRLSLPVEALPTPTPTPTQAPVVPADEPAPVSVPSAPLPTAVPAPQGGAHASGFIDKTQRQATPRERAEYRYRNAMDLAGRGDISAASAELRLVLQDDATHVPARQLWVRLLLEQGDRIQAMSLLRDGLAENPRQLPWAMLLARLEVEQGNASEAWRTLEKGLPWAASNGEYLAFAGALARQLNQPTQAAEYYRRALALLPGEGRWWVGLALSLEASGHATEAREAFLQASRSPLLPAELRTFVEGRLR